MTLVVDKPITEKEVVLSLRQRLTAEALGTFWIVFAGTAAIVVNQSTGALSHVGVALTFGLAVFAMISALADISGAHFNPAVTIGFFVAKRFPGRLVFPYVVSQMFGASLASVTLAWLLPEHGTLGATMPDDSAMQTWVMEALLALGLMFVILSVSTGAAEKGFTAALAIAGVVALEALFAGPITGASMNPARSFGPALVSGHIEHLWIYLTAPIVGAVLAVASCVAAREPGCCRADGTRCMS